MTKPLAVVVGFAGKLPLAGMALANLHVMAGLQDLGYDVHYVEHQDGPADCYDPQTNQMTGDPSVAIAFLEQVLPRHEFSAYSFVDVENRCHGSGWPTLRSALDRAAFVLDLGGASWFDELARCPRRGFVDADPMFTQVQMITAGRKASSLEHYDTLFTEGTRIGKPDCTVPLAGRTWIPTPTAIATRLWQQNSSGAGRPLSTLMNWSSGSDVVFEGRSYGYKNREFERFMELPTHTGWACVAAIGGAAPRDRIADAGWSLVSPLAVTGTIEAYQHFIAGSAADLGIVKHAYVASRCGWISDRSTCYMAAGRPVLHQDTGLGDLVPTGEGLLVFDSMETILEGLRQLEADYERHARAAVAIVKEHFEASVVLRHMLRKAGWE